MTNGYTKLFSTLIGSTLWRSESKSLKIVWITMLALANRDGLVEASVLGLADFAKVSREECEAALVELSSPDADSRTPDNEGRRIGLVEGGWKILNYGKYAAKMSLEERREYNRLKQQEYRERVKQIDRAKSVQEIMREKQKAEGFVKNNQ